LGIIYLTVNVTVNYTRIYNQLIERARNRVIKGYAERHHVIPRCMGGADNEDNIVKLTPEEHYLAHQLLLKLHPSHGGLAKAAHMMCTGRPTNKYYGWVRRKFAEAQSQSIRGHKNPVYGTRLIHNLDLRVTKRIPKEETLPQGWEEGAVYDYDLYFENQDKANKKEAERKIKKEAKVKKLRLLHEIYLEGGYEGVLETGYSKSKPNLVMQFAKYLPEFVPQNGKKRKNNR
jgi:hypothetical protein